MENIVPFPGLCKCSVCGIMEKRRFMETAIIAGYGNPLLCPTCHNEWLAFLENYEDSKVM